MLFDPLEVLELKDWLMLSLVSSSFRKQVLPFLEENATFRYFPFTQFQVNLVN